MIWNRLQFSRVWIPFLSIVLLTCTACTVRRDFERAVQEDTIQAYESFLKEHPDKESYTSRATERLDALAFELARRKDTYTGYLDYLERFPFGTYSRLAAARAEDLRAEELGIHLYRTLPDDYYDRVDPRELPYRILVRSSDPAGIDSEHVEQKWFEELKRRDLMVPMDPREASVVSPDMTLYVRESVIRFCAVPRALIEAEIWIGDKKIKRYRIAGDRIEPFLLYEIFADRDLYDAILQIPDKEEKEVAERFQALKATFPIKGSLALEFDSRQDSWNWDRELTLAYIAFLRNLTICQDFVAFPRGKPSDRVYKRSVFFRVDPEIHSPSLRRQWSTSGPYASWRAWNSKWILRDRDYFFKRMTLELLQLIESSPPASPHVRRHIPTDSIQWP